MTTQTLNNTATTWRGCMQPQTATSKATKRRTRRKVNTAHVVDLICYVVIAFSWAVVCGTLGAWLALGTEELEGIIIAWKAGLM